MRSRLVTARSHGNTCWKHLTGFHTQKERRTKAVTETPAVPQGGAEAASEGAPPVLLDDPDRGGKGAALVRMVATESAQQDCLNLSHWPWHESEKKPEVILEMQASPSPRNSSLSQQMSPAASLHTQPQTGQQETFQDSTKTPPLPFVPSSASAEGQTKPALLEVRPEDRPCPNQATRARPVCLAVAVTPRRTDRWPFCPRSECRTPRA